MFHSLPVDMFRCLIQLLLGVAKSNGRLFEWKEQNEIGSVCFSAPFLCIKGIGSRGFKIQRSSGHELAAFLMRVTGFRTGVTPPGFQLACALTVLLKRFEILAFFFTLILENSNIRRFSEIRNTKYLVNRANRATPARRILFAVSCPAHDVPFSKLTTAISSSHQESERREPDINNE